MDMSFCGGSSLLTEDIFLYNRDLKRSPIIKLDLIWDVSTLCMAILLISEDEGDLRKYPNLGSMSV